MSTRTYGGILIGKEHSNRLAIQVFGLDSKQITYTYKFKLMPMTDAVIERINTIAYEDQEKKGTKRISNKPYTYSYVIQ